MPLGAANAAQHVAHHTLQLLTRRPGAAAACTAGLVLKRVPQGERDAAGEPLPGTHDVNIARPALQRALYAALPPGTVTCGAAFRSFVQRPDGRVEVRLVLDSGKEVTEVADVLVGADGIWSAVRTQIDGACWPGWLAGMGGGCCTRFPAHRHLGPAA